MTGQFLRIKRQGPRGPARPVDIDEMTDEELAEAETILAEQPAWQLATWITGLAKYIRDQRQAERRDGSES